MAASTTTATMSQSGWALPIDILHYVARLLIPKEPYQGGPDGFESRHFARNIRTLRQLTYLCRATRVLLEPLTFRFVLLEDAADIVDYFLHLAQNPHARQFVRHVVCLSPMDWAKTGTFSITHSYAQRIWSARAPAMRVDQVMQQAGFNLNYYSITEGQKRMLYPNLVWADMVKFLFGSILLMVPGVETLYFHYSHTDPDSYGTNIVGDILKDAADRGYPVMKDLRLIKLSVREDEIISEAAELFFFETCLWDNLCTMVLDDIDFDDQFGQLILENPFSAELPVEELYVRGHRRGGLLGEPGLVDNENWGMRMDSVFQHIGYDTVKDSARRVFKHLRLLDIVFPPSKRISKHGSTMLPVFLEGIGGTPETLRLARHPFPAAYLRQAVHPRLKTMVLMECTNMPEKPTTEELESEVSKLIYSDASEPCLPNMELMVVNGGQYQPVSEL